MFTTWHAGAAFACAMVLAAALSVTVSAAGPGPACRGGGLVAVRLVPVGSAHEPVGSAHDQHGLVVVDGGARGLQGGL